LDLKAPDNVPRWLAQLGIAVGRRFGSIDEWAARRPWEAVHAAMQDELADLSWTELCFGTAFLAAGSRGSRLRRYVNPAAGGSRTPAQDSCDSAQLRGSRSKDRTCVLVASAGARRDPSGRAPRTWPGRRRRANRPVGYQPRHGNPRVPRPRAGGPAREDAGAVPGGGLPGAGQVRLPERRRRGRRAAGPARPHRV